MKKYIGLWWLYFGIANAYAQTATISGYATDADTGEALVGATVVDSLSNRAVTSNRYGFYSLTLPKGGVVLSVSYVGFQPQRHVVNLSADTTLAIRLIAATLALGEVTVTGRSAQQLAPLGIISLPIERLRVVPSLLGEPDIIKALALTPGVSVGNEGTTGLLVRGGTPDQNLILLDEATVYNAAHLFGFVSIFNPDAIKSIDLYKAGFPARFGGRLSSVLDITMKEGNNQKMQGEFGLGLLSSRLNLEGPIHKGRTSFMVSARSSYLSLFLLPNYIGFRQGKIPEYFNYWFYDVNGKINHQFKDGSRLFFSVYHGNDRWNAQERSAQSESRVLLQWGNTTATARYSRVLNPRLFFRSVLTYTRYRYGLEGTNLDKNSDGTQTSNQFLTQSTVRDWTWRTGFDFFPSPKHQVRFGSEITYHTYHPTALSTTDAILRDSLQKVDARINAGEYALYVEDEAQFTDWLKTNVGLRSTAFGVEGRTYASLEPRLALNFLLPRQFALKTSYSLMRQYIHLLSSNSVGLPNDIWVPATRQVAPQFSSQVALGLTKTLPKLGLELTLEGYYKKMSHLIDYKQGTNFLIGAYNRNWQQDIETGGVGEGYGLEVFVNRTKGRFTGWLSYTWSWNQRKFANINNGDWYPARYDRRHNVAITGNYRFSSHWNVSATWVYWSGQPVTLPVGIQEDIDGKKVFIYAGRNNARMSGYHRLDLGVNYSKQTRRNRTATWSFGVYNVYNRANPFYLDFDTRYGSGTQYPQPVQQQLVQYSLFPLLPSISYSLKF